MSEDKIKNIIIDKLGVEESKITMDADFQHSPYFINDFVCIKPDISIVYGKRNLLHPMPLHRIISNYITSKIISFVFMAEVYDSQCGFRRYKLEDINKIIVYENGYQYETEILIKSIKMNLSISPVSISTIYSNEISNLPFIKNILSFAKLIIILRIYD